MQEQMFNLSSVPVADGVQVVNVRPNLWLLTSEEIPPILFSVDECARMLGVGRPKVFKLIQLGRLRSVKVVGSRRVSARALSDYVAAEEAS